MCVAGLLKHGNVRPTGRTETKVDQRLDISGREERKIAKVIRGPRRITCRSVIKENYTCEESYWELMKSGVADMVNTGTREGGAITAALFLKEFVDEKVQWMHIDIAGPVWNDKKKSATGFGIATMVEWVLKNSS